MINILRNYPKRRRIAKRFTPTEEQRAVVRALAGRFVSQRLIATMIPGGPISVDTLQRHFKAELLVDKQNAEPFTEREMLIRKATAKPSRRQLDAVIRYLREYAKTYDDPGSVYSSEMTMSARTGRQGTSPSAEPKNKKKKDLKAEDFVFTVEQREHGNSVGAGAKQAPLANATRDETMRSVKAQLAWLELRMGWTTKLPKKRKAVPTFRQNVKFVLANPSPEEMKRMEKGRDKK